MNGCILSQSGLLGKTGMHLFLVYIKRHFQEELGFPTAAIYPKEGFWVLLLFWVLLAYVHLLCSQAKNMIQAKGGFSNVLLVVAMNTCFQGFSKWGFSLEPECQVMVAVQLSTIATTHQFIVQLLQHINTSSIITHLYFPTFTIRCYPGLINFLLLRLVGYAQY